MFKNKAVRYALLVALFHYLVLDAARPFISLYAETCGASNVEIGYIVSAYSLVQVFSALFVGKALDKWGIRIPSLIGAFAFVISSFMFAIFKTIPGFMAASVLMGVSHGILLLAIEAITTGIKDPTERASSVGMLTSFNSIGIFLGPTMGGWMTSLFGFQGAFVGCAALSILPAVFIFLLPDKSEDVLHASVPKQAAPKTSTLTLLMNRSIMNCLILSACVFFALDVMSTYLSLYCKEAANLDEALIGYVLSAKGISQLLIRMSMGFWCIHFKRKHVFAASLLIGAVCTALIGFANSFWPLMLLSILVGAALGLANPFTLMSVSDVSTDETLSRILALRLMFGYAAQAASPIVFGALADLTGSISPVFWGSGAVMLLCVALSGWINTKPSHAVQAGAN